MERTISVCIIAAWLCISAIAISAQSDFKSARVEKQGTIFEEIEEAEEYIRRDFTIPTGEDFLRGSKAQYRFTFSDTQGHHYALPENFDGKDLVGKKVTLTARADRMKLSNVNVQSVEENFLITPALAGAYKVLVVALSFNAAPGSPDAQIMTMDEARRPLFVGPKSVNEFTKAASFNQVWLTGHSNPNADVEYVNLNVNLNECQQKLTNEWRMLIIQTLQSRGIDWNWYRSIYVVYDNSSGLCPWSSAGMRPVGNLSAMWASMPKATYLGFTEGVAHEMGHMFGWQHSSGLRCPSNPSSIAACQYEEYADGACVMGGHTYSLPSTYHRRKLSWHAQPYREILFPMSMLDLISPSFYTPGGLSPKSFRSGQNFYIPLSGGWAGYSLYWEARKKFQPFDTFTLNSMVGRYDKGVKLTVAPNDFHDSNSVPLIIDTEASTPNYYDAALLESSFTIGGVTTTNSGPRTAMTGTRISISF